MSQKNYLYVLRFGIFFSFLSVFFVFKNLLFPYITSKQLFFNVLIEILAIIWLVFIIKYPQWRPKINNLTISIMAYFGVVLLSSFFSVDFNLSFWGDIERMLGWFHLLHFLLFYWIIITVFRTWEDWKLLFLVSIITALFVSFHGILQHFEVIKSPWGSSRIIATIGNSSYVGAYAIFYIYFCILIINRDRNILTKLGLGSVIFFLFLALIYSGTRGAYLGFSISIALFGFLTAILSKNRTIKIASLGALAVLVILVSLAFSYRESDAVKGNFYLSRFTRFSLTDATTMTRFLSWKAAWLDFKQHPILGVGYGNYAVTFDKHFDPTFFNYTKSETYFDRAHNNLVDITATTGLLGLFSYLSIFIIVIYRLLRGFLEKRVETSEFILISCLLIAYFIQNLLVFDAMVTYIALMLAFGYINWITGKTEEKPEYKGESDLTLGKMYFIGLSAIFIVFVMYSANIKTWIMLDRTIAAQNHFSATGDIKQAVEIYRSALALDTPLDRDSRTTLVRLVSGNPNSLSSLKPDDAKAILDFAIEAAEKNMAYNPHDSLNQMILAQMYGTAMAYYQNDGIKSQEYFNKSMNAIDKSIEASPGRLPVYFYKAQLNLMVNQKEKALEIIDNTIRMNPRYSDSYCQLARIHFFYKEDDKAMENMDKCLEFGGDESLNQQDYLIMLIKKYEAEKDWKNAINLTGRLVGQVPGEKTYWINLAKFYALDYDLENAKKAADKAIELDASLKDSAQKFIKQLEEDIAKGTSTQDNADAQKDAEAKKNTSTKKDVKKK